MLKTWDIHITVRHLNQEQWEKFLYHARSAQDAGLPIEAELGKLQVVEGKIEADSSSLYGSDRGAAAILKEFVNCLDSSCKEVYIEIPSLSSTGFEALLKAIETLNAPEFVQVKCPRINYSEKGNEFNDAMLIVQEEAIGSLPSLVKPLFPELS